MVDYIGCTEDITEIYRCFAKEVNHRLRNSNLKLNETIYVSTENSATENPTSSAISLFQQNPSCLGSVEKNFAQDLNKLGYINK